MKSKKMLEILEWQKNMVLIYCHKDYFYMQENAVFATLDFELKDVIECLYFAKAPLKIASSLWM